MIYLLFRFTVKGTVLRNVVMVRSTAHGPPQNLHREPPCLKNRSF
jgi:hypothetical protein